MADLHELSVLDLAAAIRRREVSVPEVTEHALNRAERLDAQVGAFITRTPELAMEQARDAQRQLDAAGQADVPPLLGVPCPIKDLTMVAGVPMTAGSAALADFVPEVDDGVVTRLREAGTVMIGKTNTPEFGMPCYTEPDIAPPARTPWDLTRIAGGSSGGAAAAVAAGIVPIAHGSDGGGSIRIPAAACGLVGLKPSRGRVSTGPHGVDGAALATHGVLTRTVADTAAALDVLSRGWPGDSYRLEVPDGGFREASRRPPGSLVVGVLTDPIIAPDTEVHPQALAAVRRAEELLTGMGHEIRSAPVPFPAKEWEPFRALWGVMAASAPLPPEAEENLVPLTRWLRESGAGVSGLSYAAAITAGQQLTRTAAAAWADFDVILTPSLAAPPPPIGQLRNDADPAADFEAQMAFTPWTSTWNILGWPAMSLPLHWAAPADGASVLPFGVTIGAPRIGSEGLLLSLGAALEAADPWTDRRPPVW